MLDFKFDKSIQDQIRTISSEFDLEYWKKVDHEKRFPSEYWDSLARNGLFGILIDEKYGGMNKGILDLTLAVLETSRHYAGLGSYLYLSGSLVSRIFTNNANDELKDEILPQLAKGKLKISIALSEDHSGQDASSILTRASQIDPKSYLLDGGKTFLNNADLADYLIVFARTAAPSPTMKKSLGVTMFLVDAKSEKIQKTKLERLGMNFCNSFSIDFHDLIVESSRVIGQVDRAWYNVVDIFNMDRILTAASLIGTGRLALEEASKWATKRTVFGKLIGSNQGIQFPLADAAAQLEVAEAITMKAAALVDEGKKFSDEASFALFSSVNAATAATDRALQTFGGHGYYKDHNVDRFWRDVRAHRVHPISEELLLASIAERSLGLPRSY